MAKEKKQLSNKEFSKQDEPFNDACEKVREFPRYGEFAATKRQASKYRMGKGMAYKVANGKIKQR
jgi:hypothetical protein